MINDFHVSQAKINSNCHQSRYVRLAIYADRFPLNSKSAVNSTS